MKRTLLCMSLALAMLPAVPAAADVGVSIAIGDPHFYGRLDLGGFAPPPLIYSAPILIQRGYGPLPPLVYLRVPPGHERHWNRYCSQYHACGVPVYFVRDDWYRNEYAPRYREYHRHDGRPPYGRGRPDGQWQNRGDGRGNDHPGDGGRRDWGGGDH